MFRTKNISIVWHIHGFILQSRYFLWNVSYNHWTTQIKHYFSVEISIIKGNIFKFECKSIKIPIFSGCLNSEWKEWQVINHKAFWSAVRSLLSAVWYLHISLSTHWKECISDSVLFLVVGSWNTYMFVW